MDAIRMHELDAEIAVVVSNRGEEAYGLKRGGESRHPDGILSPQALSG